MLQIAYDYRVYMLRPQRPSHICGRESIAKGPANIVFLIFLVSERHLPFLCVVADIRGGQAWDRRVHRHAAAAAQLRGSGSAAQSAAGFRDEQVVGGPPQRRVGLQPRLAAEPAAVACGAVHAWR